MRITANCICTMIAVAKDTMTGMKLSMMLRGLEIQKLVSKYERPLLTYAKIRKSRLHRHSGRAKRDIYKGWLTLSAGRALDRLEMKEVITVSLKSGSQG